MSRIRTHLGSEIAGATTLDPDPMAPLPTAPEDPRDRAGLEAALASLASLRLDRGKISDDFPDVTWMTIDGDGGPLEYTILANRIYKSNSRALGDALPGLSRQPELDSIGVVRGHIGSYPQLFIELPLSDVGQAIKIATESRAKRLEFRKRYEIRRNSDRFWSILDREHSRLLMNNPIDAGIIDTSRYLWPLDQ